LEYCFSALLKVLKLIDAEPKSGDAALTHPPESNGPSGDTEFVISGEEVYDRLP